MKKIWVLIADHARLVVKLTVGVMLFAQMATADTHYVATNGPGPSPYTSWGTAANNIQDAINVALGVGDTVLVSNGVYETGGVTNWPAGTVLTNRVAITNSITNSIIVRSANNDPANTIIKGSPSSDGNTNGLDAVRCVYMANNSSLIGFTLTNGATMITDSATNYNHSGGGVLCLSATPIISNCVISGNAANYRGAGAYYGTLYNCLLTGNRVMTNSTGTTYSRGGGACYSTLYNCRLIGNYARYIGGGADYAILYNCLVTGNSTDYAGGDGASWSHTYNCTIVNNKNGVRYPRTMYNCIIYSNSVANWGDILYGGATNSCTTPAIIGVGNITDNPMLVDTNTANYRVSANSPCVNTGTNMAWMVSAGGKKDLDGHSRIDRFSDLVDMGCYEYLPNGTMFRVR